MSIGTRHIKMVIIDEAGDMLNEGFKDQIYNIFVEMPENIQIQFKYFIL